MTEKKPSVRIGIYGAPERIQDGPRGCALWAPGYVSVLGAAGATPVPLGDQLAGQDLDDVLGDLHGLIFTSSEHPTPRQQAEEERVLAWCRQHTLPVLAVDFGLLALNAAHGGTTHLDLPRDLPEALQHRHPPERGLRHAILVEPGTRMADFYGEGEIVVNSEHRRAVAKIARNFVVCAKALDGVVEAIESTQKDWFAVGVQWRPASESASGLDIQLFRGLIEACEHWQETSPHATLCQVAA